MARKKKQEEQDLLANESNESTEVLEQEPEVKKPEPKKRKVIEIRSATLQGFFFCNYTYDHNVAADTTNTVTCKSKVPVHPDLKEAFSKLDAHLAVICEEVDATEIKSIDFIPEVDPVHKKLKKFSVSSIRLDDYDEKEGVVLVGQKLLSTGESVGLQTPKIKWNGIYAFTTELRIAVIEALMEVEQYMKGKQADDPQLDLFDEEEHYAEEGL